MAEWLGRGLQNLVQRFESASDLSFSEQTTESRLFLFWGDSYEQAPEFPQNKHSQKAITLSKNILFGHNCEAEG